VLTGIFAGGLPSIERQPCFQLVFFLTENVNKPLLFKIFHVFICHFYVIICETLKLNNQIVVKH